MQNSQRVLLAKPRTVEVRHRVRSNAHANFVVRSGVRNGGRARCPHRAASPRGRG